MLELRKSLLGLYEAHRYFIVWLKDELFPMKSTLNDLMKLKPKHLLQKLRRMGDNESTLGAAAAEKGGDKNEREVLATALMAARQDWKDLHGDMVRAFFCRLDDSSVELMFWARSMTMMMKPLVCRFQS